MKVLKKYNKLFMLVACTALLISPVNTSYAKNETVTLPRIYEENKDTKDNNILLKETIKESKQTNKIRFIPRTSSGKILDSGTWIIKDKNGKVVKTFTITKKVNKFETELKTGSYTLEQQKAPNGYIKDNKKVNFSLPINIDKEKDAFEIYPKFLSIENNQDNERNQNDKNNNKNQNDNTGNNTRPNERNYKTGGLDIKILLSAFVVIFPIVFVTINKLLRGERNEK
ncbi:MAG: prealbumin-like fold domain-containing protein [Finegoldia magna]|uniref:prealbumin-like fold domain-containing protein n=1 Tax=Finegoldia magna TaxID=1260 RepID=UPI0029121275|nr:prealbumin-like fold domain-containing protein [Finegoldia magna]MDU5527616.1 prealbumin-like fold domain-containing protein [Finegoldia magna]